MALKAVLDANGFIGAVTPGERDNRALRKIVAARDAGKVAIGVSVHTLHELRNPNALALAETATVLPHFLIGTWADQVAAWGQVTGTWEDQRRADEIFQDLQTLAKSGADIRDLGAYVDALHGVADVFVTSDLDVAGTGPASRIAKKYGLRILTPRRLADELGMV